MVAGYVYILVNAAMQDMLKIGMTTRTPKERAQELSQGTGIPAPYSVAYWEQVPDCTTAEAMIHNRLARFRVQSGREFFHLDLKLAIDELREIAAEVRRSSDGALGSDTASLAKAPVAEDFPEPKEETRPLARAEPASTSETAFVTANILGKPARPFRAASAESQRAIVDAILGAYPFNNAGNWLSAKRQIELLRLTYDAKMPDGRNAFPAMHGGSAFGDAPRSWDGKDRTNRMKEHVDQKRAFKAEGQNLYMLAEGVIPADLGVSQTIVDALASHGIIPRYEVGFSNLDLTEGLSFS